MCRCGKTPTATGRTTVTEGIAALAHDTSHQGRQSLAVEQLGLGMVGPNPVPPARS